MSGVAKREIPADPVLRAVLRYQNRAQQIVGRQRQIITCWLCHRDYPEGSDGYVAAPGLLAVCRDEHDCNDRAARADLVLVLGEPANDTYDTGINTNGGTG